MQTAASARRRVRGWFTEASDAIVSVFFPAGCRICDKLLTLANRVPICEECLGSFEAIREKPCGVFGQAPRACQQKKYAFERARSYGAHDGPLVNAILILKWERMEPLGAWFARRLADLARMESGLLAADAVVPVPPPKAPSGNVDTTKRDLFRSLWLGSFGFPIRPC
jgi:predicted amidophosphoribosyltransferase